MNVEQIKRLVPEIGDIPLFITDIAELAISAVEQGHSIETAQLCLNGAAAGWFQGVDGPVLGIQIDAMLPHRTTPEELRAVLLHEVGHIRLEHIPTLEETLSGVGLNGTFEGREQEADMFALEHGVDIIDLGNGVIKTLMCQLAQTAVAYKAIKGDEMSHARKTRYLRGAAVSHKARLRAYMALSKQF